MKHDPTSRSTVWPSQADARETVRIERRSQGLNARFNRRLGRVSKGTATLLLTAFADLVAVSLCWLLGVTDLMPFNASVAISAFAIATVTAAPITYYALGIIRDLASSRRALALMTEQLAVAFHNAEAANAAKSRFLTNMSHELRTPLNAVIGFSDIMQNQRFGPIENARYVEYCRDINASGMHLLGIINDILDLAKIESGQSSVENETDFDMMAVVNSACAMLRPLVIQRNVMLDVEALDRTVHLRAVERMIRQILLNVISNAIKYTGAHGTVKISFDCQPDGSLLVAVSDSGIGMSADEIKIALTPFGQVSNNLTNVPQGTGLGLPLAKAMMGLHEGQLTMRSHPGRGTKVSLHFPAERVIVTRGICITGGALTARAS